MKPQGESPADYASLTLAAAGDTDGDGFSDFLIGSYADDDGGTEAGAAYLIRGGGL